MAPEITESSLMAAFGLTAPGQGAQEQEIAEPAAEAAPADPNQGAQGQEPAEPAEGSDHTGADPEPADDDGQAGQEEPGKQTMSQEQRRANAARRRQQEQQAAIDAAVQAEKDRIAAEQAQFFRDANLKNTFTGKPITNMQEFREWKTEFDAKKTEQAVKTGKMTPEVLNDMISRHPVVQKAQSVIDQAELAAKQQREAADKARLDGELAEIRKLNPDIKTVADLLQSPCAEAFRANIKKGMGLYDAYRLADFDRLTAAKAEVARQQALNQSRGKDHLNPVGMGRGPGTVNVPADQMRYFRSLMPDKTDAEIQAFYNKHKAK